MAKDIHELRFNLVEKIQNSEPGTYVIRVVDTAIKTLLDSHVQHTIITSFIDTVNHELERLRMEFGEEEQLRKVFHIAATRLRKLKMNLTQQAKIPVLLTINQHIT